jgi:hypothetical protein
MRTICSAISVFLRVFAESLQILRRVDAAVAQGLADSISLFEELAEKLLLAIQGVLQE